MFWSQGSRALQTRFGRWSQGQFQFGVWKPNCDRPTHAALLRRSTPLIVGLPLGESSAHLLEHGLQDVEIVLIYESNR